MPVSTWKWIGGTGQATVAANWTLVAGPGNAFGTPRAFDTAINAGGTVLTPLDAGLTANTVEAGGTAGAAALSLTGDSGINLANPTFDNATFITSAVPGNTTAETSLLVAAGNFVNQGTILANGPAGSSFTIDITANGTAAGYAYNTGVIQADAHNTLIINIGSAAELVNVGSVIADGGYVQVVADTSAIAGGYAPARGFAQIEAGGTLETNAAYGTIVTGGTVTGTLPVYEFADATPGNTLKIDNIGSFGGNIVGFALGDTIDLGVSLSVGTLAFDRASALLYLESNTGSIEASLLVGGPFATGTFAATSGTADGFVLSTGADGNTLLTSTDTLAVASGISGAWQSPGSWANGTVPGTNDVPWIGQSAAAPFTLTTGSSPVSALFFGLTSALATLQITSNTTATAGTVADYNGTLDVMAGNTLTAEAINSYAAQNAITIQAGATVALSGRLSPNLASVNGVWTPQNGNKFAATFSAGTAEIDGALLGGPPTAAGGGGNIAIGYDSNTSANVTVTGTVTDTYTNLGSDPTSSGTLTLSGAGARWTDMLDASDPSSPRGYILVGYNNLSSNTPAGLTPPAPASAAQLTIENGATLTDQWGGYIADSHNSDGIATVESSGVWNLANNNIGFLSVGYLGDGTLSVLNGGTVEVGAAGGPITPAGTNPGGIGVGRSLGAHGTVLVSGAGALLSTLGGMSVGQNGQGLLEIMNGGSVEVLGGGLNIGNNQSLTGAGGTVIVGGTGAAAALDFAAASTTLAAASGMTVGNHTQGTLTVADNGAINLNGTGGLTIGNNAGVFGDVVVGGTTAAAVINIGTFGITVGNSGTGDLTVNSLGTISLTGTNGILVGGNAGGSGLLTIENGGTVIDNGSNGFVTVGGGAGSSGSIVVGGTTGNSTLNISIASLTVGNQGTGDVTVKSGGAINVTGTVGGGIFVGQSATAVGALTVDGGLVYDGPTSNGMTVGFSSTQASVLVENSGTVSLAGGGLTIGSHTGANSTFTVQDTNSELLTAGTTGITVGQSGSGTLVVTSGGTVSDGNGLSIGSGSGASGTVTVTGPGSMLTATGGIKDGQSGAGLLQLGAGAVVNTGASTIVIGSQGSIAGAGLVQAAVANAGEIAAEGGTLEITGTLGGAGGVTLDAGSMLKLDGAVTGAGTFLFGSGSPETLVLGTPGTGFANAIQDLGHGDRIEFSNGITVTSASIVNGNSITVDFTQGASAGVYDFTNVTFAAGATSPFLPGTDPVTDYSYFEVACFAAGTRIETRDGPVPVEQLQAGDLIRTLGDAPARPVTWIGRRHLDLTRHREPDLVRPIRILADAFADGMPNSDLRLSPDHAVLLDNQLIPIRLLVNGASIVQEADARSITYYHIELDQHDILLADGMPSESYLDTGNRGMFENANGGLVLHPDFAAPNEIRVANSCRPFIDDVARAEEAWRRLAVRALALGLTLPDDPATTEDPDLHIVAAGRAIRPINTDHGRFLFVLPPTANPVRLASRSARPCDLSPWVEDRRRLGVMVSRLTVRQGMDVATIPPDHPGLSQGWYAVESDGASPLRWTNGDAVLPLSEMVALQEGVPTVLEVMVVSGLRYPLWDCADAAATSGRMAA